MAKYVSEKSASGSANVAKWGFTIEANSENLFGEDYKKSGAYSVVTTDDNGLTVSASTESTNVVAPGTTGSLTFSVKGSAEVKTQIKLGLADGYTDIALRYTEGENTQVNTYNPVKWTLKKGDTTLVDKGTLTAVSSALNNQYAAATEVNTEINDTFTLSWVWEFTDSVDESTTTNDQLDTLLGMIANDNNAAENGNFKKAADTENEKTSTTISFDLKISVTQVAE